MPAYSLAVTQNHVRYIVTCVAILAAICVVAGSILIWKGYQGDVLLNTAATAIGGLVGVLTLQRAHAEPSSPKSTQQ